MLSNSYEVGKSDLFVMYYYKSAYSDNKNGKSNSFVPNDFEFKVIELLATIFYNKKPYFESFYENNSMNL